MATATKQARVARHSSRPTVDVARSAANTFRVFETNDGNYHWAIVSGKGETLARSGAFASYGDAERAATLVRDSAGSARVEARPADTHSLVKS